MNSSSPQPPAPAASGAQIDAGQLPWQPVCDAEVLAASADWPRNDSLCDSLSTDAGSIRNQQLPAAFGRRWLHGFGQARVPGRDPGVFLAADSDGLGWDMPACAHYCGAALVSTHQVSGDFDARLEFKASHLAPGIALELSAITLGAQSRMRVDAATQAAISDGPRSGHSLVFDVHGTPPYVCAECDEDNGFRIAWNASYTLTEFVADLRPWEADPRPVGRPQSSNLYNVYGADSLPQAWPQSDQWHGLRLIRLGHRFACLVQPGAQGQWQCAGQVRHVGMPASIHLRVAAKHWVKGDRPYASATRIRLRNFVVAQAAAGGASS